MRWTPPGIRVRILVRNQTSKAREDVGQRKQCEGFERLSGRGGEAPGQLGLQGAPSRGLGSALGAPARGLGGPCPGCGSRAGASGGRGRRERRGTRGEVQARRGVAVTAGNVRRMPAATVTAVAPSLPCHRRRPPLPGLAPAASLCPAHAALRGVGLARAGRPRRAERVNDLTLLRVCPAAARAGGQGDS